MKIIVLLTLSLLTINLYSVETQEYVLKFKEYNKNIIKDYHENYDLKKYFTSSDKTLLTLKENGEKLSGNKLADLRTYFLARLTSDQHKDIKNDRNISTVYKNIKNIPRPVITDIAPITSSWVNIQGYIHDFATKGGLDAEYGWKFTGGAGKNVTVVDMEGGWTHDHEDLGIEDPYLYDELGKNISGTPFDGENHDNNHGTSVLGEIASANNEYGTTGIAYNSNMKVVNDYSKEFGYSTADAIIRAIPTLDKGSIILLESQKGGPNYEYDANNPGSQFGLVPDEWLQAEFDAIKIATSNDIIIIEAGANGEQNLDDAIYHTCNGDINTYWTDKSGTQPCFDIKTRDSGAIIVGAGNPPSSNFGTPLEKMYYTSFGLRVDVQAWGAEIYTTGYGDLFYPNNDDKQAYTGQFGGTSGASPMVTAVVAQLQSRYKEKNNGNYLKAKEIRDIIKNPLHSNAQKGNPVTAHIGPQPNTKLIFENFLNDSYNCTVQCQDWEKCDFETAKCVIKEDRCANDENCSENLHCNLESHTCVTLCSNLECEDWQICDEVKGCILEEGKCATDNDCTNLESCNPVVNKCVDPCDNFTCNIENTSCKRYSNNTTAACECNTGYTLNSENICIQTVIKKKDSDSCNFSSNKNNSLPFIFILFISLFLIRKKYREQ